MLRTIFSHQTSKPKRWILLMDESLHLLMVGRFSHYLEGFYTSKRWLFGISEPSPHLIRWCCQNDGHLPPPGASGMGVAVFFFAQHGNSPFFWYQKFCEKLICDVFFLFYLAKRQPFFWTETAVFYFLALETAPKKKPHIDGQDPANQGPFQHH